MKFCLSIRNWAALYCVVQLAYLTGCGGSEPPPPLNPAPSSSPAVAMGDPGLSSDSESEGDEMPGDGGMGGMEGIMPSSLSDGYDDTAGMMMPGGADMYDGGESSYAGMMPGGMSPGMSPDMYGGMGGMGMGGMGMGGMGMGGMGQPAFVDPAPPEDADYLTKAKYAFAIGKEAVAEQYAMAHLLASDEDAASLLQQIRYSPGSRKPTLVSRFAVGVTLTAPGNVTDYKPIGRTQFAQQQGGGGMGGEMSMGMAMGGPGQGGQNAQKSLGDLTGRFGEELIKSFETAWDAGSFGSVFKDVETQVPAKRPTGPGGMGGMGDMYAMGMGGMGGMSPDLGGEGYGGMPGTQQPGAAATDAALRLKAIAGQQIVPGLLFVGTGSQSELLGKIEAEGIDFLFLFEVDVKLQRNGLTDNNTRLRLLTTKDSKPLGATTTLNNMKVDREMALKGDKDEVAKNLSVLFRKVDEQLKLVDMPALKPAGAQARVKSLIEKKTTDPLPALMEIKLFHSLGLLNDEERDAAYQLTIGGHGLAFVNGTAEDRDFVLAPFLSAYK